jgi:radical SAM superfamily enzyme YgiQ (UPF0313 family)
MSALRVALLVPHTPDGNTTPPLGPLYLLAALEQAGFDGHLFDQRIDRDALERLNAYSPDLVGVSAVTSAYRNGLRAVAHLRRARPGLPVVFGGPHASALPEEVAAEPGVDFVLTGESERSLVELCRVLQAADRSPAALGAIPGLAWKEEGAVRRTAEGGPLSADDLDTLPWPALHRMDLDRYFEGTQTHGLFRRGSRVLPVMTTRGCPSGCTYCCRVMGRRLRCREVVSVIAEIEDRVRRYGADEIYVEDDNFTVDRGRALEVLARIEGMRPAPWIKFANGIRADRVDREILTAMKHARVYSLSFGIESGSPATLRLMSKGLDLAKARDSVLLAKSMGFLVGANCIVGYPGETVDAIEESLRFFLDLPLDSMAIVNLVPFPGTEARALCEREGWLTPEAADWDNYYFRISAPIPLVETPVLSRAQLVGAVRTAYRRMYLRPSWMLRNLRNVSLSQAFEGARVLLGGGRT